jgi:hypothetical protein
MAEYLVEIEGKYDLPQINLQISREEAGASEFVCSNISFYENRVTNIAKFKELAAGTVPAKLTLVKQGDQPPAQSQRVWSGVMVVSGTNEALSAWRQNQ